LQWIEKSMRYRTSGSAVGTPVSAAFQTPKQETAGSDEFQFQIRVVVRQHIKGCLPYPPVARWVPSMDSLHFTVLIRIQHHGLYCTLADSNAYATTVSTALYRTGSATTPRSPVPSGGEMVSSVDSLHFTVLLRIRQHLRNSVLIRTHPYTSVLHCTLPNSYGYDTTVSRTLWWQDG
jgi:hypothetical protein